MYVVSGSRQRTIMLMDEDSRLGMSPSITQGDLAPDRMSSTKLKRVSGGGEDKDRVQPKAARTLTQRLFVFLHKQVVEQLSLNNTMGCT